MKTLKQIIIISGLMSMSPALYGKVDKALEVQVKQIQKNASSQKKIDELDEKKQEKLSLYRQTVQETENLKVYNQQMQKMIASQKEEIAYTSRKIVEIEQTNKDIIPLMIEMVDTIAEFVAIDSPFLPKERNERVAELKKLLDRADVSTSEKYRRVLEAYQVEMEYGKTIEAYKDAIVIDGVKKTVDLLRLGRVGLYYVSLDGKTAAKWSKDEKNWVTLNRKDAHNIGKAIKVARKESAPSLLELPTAKAEAI
jgi:hypothetical protein